MGVSGWEGKGGEWLMNVKPHSRTYSKQFVLAEHKDWQVIKYQDPLPHSPCAVGPVRLPAMQRWVPSLSHQPQSTRSVQSSQLSSLAHVTS